MDSELREKLIWLIRSVFTEDSIIPDLEFSESDCNYLMRFATRQSIVPIVYHALKRIQSTSIDEMLSNWKLLYEKSIYDYVQRDESMRNIAKALESARIPYIPLKWSVVRYFYPEPWMRTSSDIDILVEEENIHCATSIIEKMTDFRICGNRSFHDIPMKNKRILLELHFSLKENNDNLDGSLDSVWDYLLVSDSCLKEMTPEFLIFYTVGHMSQHMIHGGVGMRAYLDLWLLVNKIEFDEDILYELLDASKLKKYFEISIQMVQSWMSSLPIDGTLLMLEKSCMRSGVYGNSISSAAANQRHHRGMRYIAKRLIADKKLLGAEYPQLKDKPHSVLLYQMKRWTRLFNKSKRRVVTNEIKAMRSITREDIEKYNQLLQDLGL